MSGHVLVVRLDSMGDMLAAGPAIRAVAAGADRVTVLCGPTGVAAASLLPGVDATVVWACPWIVNPPPPVSRSELNDLVDRIARLRVGQALILTSFHQSPLPAALLLRMAGVGTIAAICDDFPGALLDIRHRVDDDIHEVERHLSLAATLGYRLPAGDHGALAIDLPARVGEPDLQGDVIAVHPGASVPARTWDPTRYRELVDLLLAAGWRVVVTGGPDERDVTAYVTGGAHPVAQDLGGATDLAQLAAVLGRCRAVITGNTGPAHLAAAVGTPVVSLFAPTVPASRWRPWGVAHVLLGDQDIACAGCRATTCPLPGHPCLDDVTPAEVLGALHRLLADKDRILPPSVTGHPGLQMLR